MDRVSVVGCPGSGKTTFAAALAERMGTSHLELDSLYHQKDWEPLADAEFRSAVTSVIGGERWVVDGNYPPGGQAAGVGGGRRGDLAQSTPLSRHVVAVRSHAAIRGWAATNCGMGTVKASAASPRGNRRRTFCSGLGSTTTATGASIPQP